MHDTLPGVLSLAWLHGFSAPAGERVLLGFVAIAGASAVELEVYGVSANAQADGRSVTLAAPPALTR